MWGPGKPPVRIAGNEDAFPCELSLIAVRARLSPPRRTAQHGQRESRTGAWVSHAHVAWTRRRLSIVSRRDQPASDDAAPTTAPATTSKATAAASGTGVQPGIDTAGSDAALSHVGKSDEATQKLMTRALAKLKENHRE